MTSRHDVRLGGSRQLDGGGTVEGLRDVVPLCAHPLREASLMAVVLDHQHPSLRHAPRLRPSGWSARDDA